MKRDLPLKMISSLLGLLLMTESCSYFKGTQTVAIDQNEERVVNPTEACESEAVFIPEEFDSTLISLFEIQAFLINDAMVAIINQAPQELIDMGQNNLFENTHEIAFLFASPYGSQVAYRVETLLDQQMRLLLDYVHALKSQNKALAKTLLAQSYSNGRLLVEFLNIMNPFFAFEPEKYMLDEHVTIESNQAIAYLTGDIKRAEELKQLSAGQLKELAIHISKAVRMQMTECTSPYVPAVFGSELMSPGSG